MAAALPPEAAAEALTSLCGQILICSCQSPDSVDSVHAEAEQRAMLKLTCAWGGLGELSSVLCAALQSPPSEFLLSKKSKRSGVDEDQDDEEVKLEPVAAARLINLMMTEETIRAVVREDSAVASALQESLKEAVDVFTRTLKEAGPQNDVFSTLVEMMVTSMKLPMHLNVLAQKDASMGPDADPFQFGETIEKLQSLNIAWSESEDTRAGNEEGSKRGTSEASTALCLESLSATVCSLLALQADALLLDMPIQHCFGKEFVDLIRQTMDRMLLDGSDLVATFTGKHKRAKPIPTTRMIATCALRRARHALCEMPRQPVTVCRSCRAPAVPDAKGVYVSRMRQGCLCMGANGPRVRI